MIVIDVVVITNLFILVMYVHMIHHHHRALPSMYENHIIHPLHLIVHVDVVHWLLLQVVVVYSFHTSSIINVFLFCFFLLWWTSGLKRTCLITTSRVITPYGFAPPPHQFLKLNISFDFFICFDHSLVLDLFFLFFHGPWGYHWNSCPIIQHIL